MEATPAEDFIPDTFHEARHHHETAFGTLSLALSLQPRRLRPLIAAIAGVPAAPLFPFKIWQLANIASVSSGKQPTQFSRLQLRYTALATGRFTFIRATWKFSRPPRDVIIPLTSAITNSSPLHRQLQLISYLQQAGKHLRCLPIQMMVRLLLPIMLSKPLHWVMVPPLLELGVGTISCGAATSGSSPTKNTIS